MNKALLDALTQLRCDDRNDICEELRLPGQHISEGNRAHSARIVVSAEKAGTIRELEEAIRRLR